MGKTGKTMPRHVMVIMLIFMLTLGTSGTVHPEQRTPMPRTHASMMAQQQGGTAGPPSFGLNTHLATRYPDRATLDKPGQLVTELGVSWVREDFHWYRIQPQHDVWDWGFHDEAIRYLRLRDINILGVIGGPSAPWATPYADDAGEYASFYAPNTEAFVRFARAVVTRYHKHIKHWEIWNEPDNAHFWKPAPDPLAYADLLMRTSAAIKKIDPEAKVLIGGFNAFNAQHIRSVLAAGAWDSFDILAIHPYVDPYSPEEGNMSAVADTVRVLADQYGSKPIWVTEIGWASGKSDHDAVGINDEQRQAMFLVRSMLLLWEMGVERSFWYTLKDDPGNPYGLIALGDGQADYAHAQRKPAYFAFRTLLEQLEGVHFVERHDLLKPKTLLDFDTMDAWQRPVQPNGTFQQSGVRTARLQYHFSTPHNDYVAFVRDEAILLQGTPLALGVWVYGDGSGHKLNVWLRDATGEMLHLTLGVVGAPGWQFISSPISSAIYTNAGTEANLHLNIHVPVYVEALILDDFADEYVGSGTIYLDDFSVITGREVYNLLFERGNEALDVIWSPRGAIRASLSTASAQGRLVAFDGTAETLLPNKGRFSLLVGPEPVYLWHRR